MVEHLPAPRTQRQRRFPSLVVEEVLRGELLLLFSIMSTPLLTSATGQACCVSMSSSAGTSHKQHCSLGVLARVKAFGKSTIRGTWIPRVAWSTTITRFSNTVQQQQRSCQISNTSVSWTCFEVSTRSIQGSFKATCRFFETETTPCHLSLFARPVDGAQRPTLERAELR